MANEIRTLWAYPFLILGVPATAQVANPPDPRGNTPPRDAVYLACALRMGEDINHYRIGISESQGMAQHNTGQWIAAQVSNARIEYQTDRFQVTIQRSSGRISLKYRNGDGYIGNCTPVEIGN